MQVFNPEARDVKATKAATQIKKAQNVPDFAPADIYVAKLKPKEVLHNLSVAGMSRRLAAIVVEVVISVISRIIVHSFSELYEQAIAHEEGNFIVSSGALATLSGEKTGRSPKDKRVVKEAAHAEDLWWGK